MSQAILLGYRTQRREISGIQNGREADVHVSLAMIMPKNAVGKTGLPAIGKQGMRLGKGDGASMFDNNRNVTIHGDK